MKTAFHRSQSFVHCVLVLALCCAITIAFIPPLLQRSYAIHHFSSTSTLFRPLDYQQLSDLCESKIDNAKTKVSSRRDIYVHESHDRSTINESTRIMAARSVEDEYSSTSCIGYLLINDSNYELHMSAEKLDRSAASSSGLDEFVAVFHKLFMRYLEAECKAYENERDQIHESKNTSMKLILSEDTDSQILLLLREIGFAESHNNLGFELDTYLPFLNDYAFRYRGTDQANTALLVIKMLSQRRVPYNFSRSIPADDRPVVSLQKNVIPPTTVERAMRIIDDIKSRQMLSTNPDSVDGLPSLHLNLICNRRPLFDHDTNAHQQQFAQYVSQLTEMLQPHLYDELLPSVRQVVNSSTVEISDVFIRNYGVLEDLADSDSKHKTRYLLSPHYDITASTTCVITLDDTASNGRNGLYTIPHSKRGSTSNAALRQFFPLEMGDGVVHTFDVLHGVDVDPELKKSRTSLIVWFVDTNDNLQGGEQPWLKGCDDDITQFVSGLASEVAGSDIAETIEMYLSSAMQGNIFAITSLAQLCHDGKVSQSHFEQLHSVIPPNAFLPAVEEKPNAFRDLANALWYHAAIEGGNRVAQNALAHNIMTQYVKDVSHKDQEDSLLMASTLFTMSYNQGYDCLESLEKLLDIECQRLDSMGVKIPSEAFFHSPVVQVLLLSVLPSD